MLGYELGQRHTAAASSGAIRRVRTTVCSIAPRRALAAGRSGLAARYHRGRCLERYLGLDRRAPRAPPTWGELERLIAQLPGVRIAIGPPGDGIDGFRASHLAATATQRLMVRVASEVRASPPA